MDRHLFLLISLLQGDRRRLNQFNNSVFFKGKLWSLRSFLTGWLRLWVLSYIDVLKEGLVKWKAKLKKKCD